MRRGHDHRVGTCPCCGADVWISVVVERYTVGERMYWFVSGICAPCQSGRPVVTLEGKPICAATDGDNGRCTLPPGHRTDWHQEWRKDGLWAEWRGPHPGHVCGICGRDGAQH